MEINEFEAGMLDAVLEAFAGRDQLDRAELLDLFEGDEELAAAVTDILAGMDLVTKNGAETATGLAERIIRGDKAVTLLGNGGFSAQFQPEEHATAGEIDPAEIDPSLPIDHLESESELIPDVSTPEEQTSAEIPGVVASNSVSVRQTREIIFEVEIPNEDTLEFDTVQNSSADIVAEEVQPLASLFPEPIVPAAHTTEETVLEEEPFPETTALEAPAISSTDTVSLEREIAQLRKDQLRLEHKLQEKDAIIHAMATHNEQLGRFRVFIWSLLGLIALLIIGLIFRPH